MRMVLDVIRASNGITSAQITTRAGVSPRTTGVATRRLLRARLIVRIPNFDDMRMPLYYAAKESDD
jgi:DNA-binding MarR family transcriptional regulator